MSRLLNWTQIWSENSIDSYKTHFIGHQTIGSLKIKIKKLLFFLF